MKQISLNGSPALIEIEDSYQISMHTTQVPLILFSVPKKKKITTGSSSKFYSNKGIFPIKK